MAAKRIMLIPADRLTDQAFQDIGIGKNNDVKSKSNEAEDEIDKLVTFLPKLQRAKGRLIMQALKDKIHLDANSRILYDDGTLGSSLFDHLKYWTGSSGKEGIKRLIDHDQFLSLMKNNGVPLSAITKEKQFNLLQNGNGNNENNIVNVPANKKLVWHSLF